MIFTPLDLAGAYAIDLERRGDNRGFFARLFAAEEFEKHGLRTSFPHMNTSLSRQVGTVRGLHFQRPPKAETKVIRCLKGAILDVIVDLRAGSHTFGCATSLHLDDDNRTMIYIPEGFAHGFQTLAPDTELLYLHSEVYSPEHEGGIRYDDPELGIDWPSPAENLSSRDQNFPRLRDIEAIAV
tara:strand:+ start:97 stop:645 length:549 start_codon:yes stop_codon:yes gene_type:complete